MEYLLDFAEKNRDTTIIILAGYERLIERLIDSNEGLRSRFPITIHFPNYSPNDCSHILKSKMEEKEYSLCSDFMEIAEKYFEIFCKKDTFANARDVRNISDILVDIHINRVICNSENEPNDTITSDDLKQALEKWNQNINL